MSLQGRSVLVAGGAGFIGSHLVDRLIEENPARLVVVDNFFLGQEENLVDARKARKDLEVVRLDASSLASMQDVVLQHSIDAVFDLAVIPLPTSLDFPAWTIETNVGIVTTFCELARRNLIDQIVHVSSSEAYGSARYVPMDEDHPHDSITPYAASKSAADRIIESYVKTFHIKASTVRPFNNFGPRQNPGSYAGIIPIVIRRIQADLPIEIYGDGNQTRDFIFVRRTAEMILKVFQSEACIGRAINVASGCETSVNELVARIMALMNRPDHPIVYLPERPGDVRRHCADVSRARAILDHEPGEMLDSELMETIRWYQK